MRWRRMLVMRQQHMLLVLRRLPLVIGPPGVAARLPLGLPLRIPRLWLAGLRRAQPPALLLHGRRLPLPLRLRLATLLQLLGVWQPSTWGPHHRRAGGWRRPLTLQLVLLAGEAPGLLAGNGIGSMRRSAVRDAIGRRNCRRRAIAATAQSAGSATGGAFALADLWICSRPAAQCWLRVVCRRAVRRGSTPCTDRLGRLSCVLCILRWLCRLCRCCRVCCRCRSRCNGWFR